MTPHPLAASPTEQLATLIAVAAAQPEREAPEVWDGSEPDEYEGWSARDLDALADRRAGWHYYEGP